MARRTFILRCVHAEPLDSIPIGGPLEGTTVDWTMIGAIGEILGAAGVIVTLAYLAKQVRQSNIAARQEATRETLDLNDRLLADVAKNPQLASIFRRGLADEPDLSPDEVMQLRTMFLRMSFLWQRMHEHESEREIRMGATARAEIVGAPGFRKWFGQRKHWLNPEFRERLAQEIAGSPGYSTEWPPNQLEEATTSEE